jgi:hypothetical protein
LRKRRLSYGNEFNYEIEETDDVLLGLIGTREWGVDTLSTTELGGPPTEESSSLLLIVHEVVDDPFDVHCDTRSRYDTNRTGVTLPLNELKQKLEHNSIHSNTSW